MITSLTTYFYGSQDALHTGIRRADPFQNYCARIRWILGMVSP